MSSKNRVNPDHYKLAGRDPQGETIRHDRARQMFETWRARARNQNFRPGADHAVGAMGAKQGMAAGSQKATSRYGTRAMPSTRPAGGAFGRETTGTAGKRKTTPKRKTTRTSKAKTSGAPKRTTRARTARKRSRAA